MDRVAIPDLFQNHAESVFEELSDDLGLDQGTAKPWAFELRSSSVIVVVKLSKSYVWQMVIEVKPLEQPVGISSVAVAQRQEATSDEVPGPWIGKLRTLVRRALVFQLKPHDSRSVPEFVALAYVLQALTEGVETFSPKWIKTEAELESELQRVKNRLAIYGRSIFSGQVDWEKALGYLRASIQQKVAALSGRSRKAQLARKLEAAEDLYGQDELRKARDLYEQIADQLGPVEMLRLERLRILGEDLA